MTSIHRVAIGTYEPKDVLADEAARIRADAAQTAVLVLPIPAKTPTRGGAASAHAIGP